MNINKGSRRTQTQMLTDATLLVKVNKQHKIKWRYSCQNLIIETSVSTLRYTNFQPLIELNMVCTQVHANFNGFTNMSNDSNLNLTLKPNIDENHLHSNLKSTLNVIDNDVSNYNLSSKSNLNLNNNDVQFQS